MARSIPRAGARKVPKPSLNKYRWSWPLALAVGLIVALMVGFALPVLVVAVVGMLPTGVALLTDRSLGRAASRCVAAANAAGVLPVIAMVLADGHAMTTMGEVLGQAYVWLIMYGAAACGWGLLRLGPIIAQTIVARLVHREIETIKRDQGDLIKQWGRKILDD